MRTVFMGSPEFAVPSLLALQAQTQVIAVVCQPDKPAGRGLDMTPPAVKVAAEKLALPVLQPLFLRPSKSDFVSTLQAMEPDLILVTAYGKILPPEVLRIPKLGCWNVHASLLPRYRGAAPIQWALIRGETVTGVTLMQMDEGMDTGAMLLKCELPIGSDDTAGTLHDKLSELGADVLRDGLRRVFAGRPPVPVPQDHSQATMAPKLDKEHGRVDFTRGPAAVVAQLRGVDPWPGGFTTLEARGGKEGSPPDEIPMKLFGARVSSGRGTPGEVLGVDRDGLHVACGAGAVVICDLQLPGRKRMPAASLVSGFPLPRGTLLGGGRANLLLA